MAISEHDRHQLHTALDRVLGSQEATVLMSHLPPAGLADVATKSDLVQLEARLDLRIGITEQTLRAEFHQSFGAFRDETREENDGFRTEMRAAHAAFMTETRADNAAFRTEMREEFAELRDRIHRDRLRAQRQLLFVFIVALVGNTVTLAVG